MQNQFIKLQEAIKSKVLIDDMTLAMYATDASIYQIIPEAVILVESDDDVVYVVNFARQHGYKILARGGATSLAGQTVAKAIILDFSKYMTKIISFDKEKKLVKVQPGVIREELNQYLLPSGLHFAPDPATSNRATIGGMIANNSSGTKSILYGKTSDYIHSLKVLLSDGSIVVFDKKEEVIYNQITEGEKLESDIYRKVRKIVFDHQQEIIDRFPKIMRRVSGYALDNFIDNKQWNLSHLICGSEGTLGIILEATIALVPLPKRKGICLLHFQDRMEAIRYVEHIVSYGPSAVEMLDHNVLLRCKHNIATIKQYNSVVTGEPEALLICEFFADSSTELEVKLHDFVHSLKSKYILAHPIYLSIERMNDVWNLRKKGLGLLMGIPSDKKPLPFIEDSSIPLPHLADYIQQISNFCTSIDTEVVLYAHASVGVLHIRPYLNILERNDIDKMLQISNFALGLVKKYGGSWSGEHGDGLVRSPNLPSFFGPVIMQCFKDVKEVFDPENMFNPHKKTDAFPMDQNLRYGTHYKDISQEFVFQYRKEKSFESIVHLCSGISACRNKSTEAMCPSYRATMDEKDSPRGRANALRMVMSGQIVGENLLSDKLIDVLELCLSCKACKSECPSNVDIAKLKSEIIQLRHDAGKTSRMQKMIAQSDTMSKWFSGPIAPLVNIINRQSIIKNILEMSIGIDKRRNLPAYTRYSLIHWYHRQKKTNIGGKKVILFADITINFHETSIGKAAFRLLLSCGYDVEIVYAGSSQRPRISNGFLQIAKKEGTKTAMNLLPYLEKGIPVLVCEPGSGSALMDDLPDLIEDNRLAKLMRENIYLIDEFLAIEKEEGFLSGSFILDSHEVVVHTHCHQAALYGAHTMKNLCSHSGVRIDSENTGCCGMAGAFGYETANYKTSKKVAERNIIPKVERMTENSLLIVNGTSCRHQFFDMTGKKALHWVEAVHYKME